MYQLKKAYKPEVSIVIKLILFLKVIDNHALKLVLASELDEIIANGFSHVLHHIIISVNILCVQTLLHNSFSLFGFSISHLSD